MAITYSSPNITLTGGKDTGTATGGTSTTLTDTGKSWTTNAYAGRLVIIHTGTGGGTGVAAIGLITSNTATVLTVDGGFYAIDAVNRTKTTITPDNTSQYVISYNMQDIKDANDSGSWGVVSKQDTSQFALSGSAKIVVGNASTKTFFATLLEDIDFSSSVTQPAIGVKSAGYFCSGAPSYESRGSSLHDQRTLDDYNDDKAVLYTESGGYAFLFGGTQIRTAGSHQSFSAASGSYFSVLGGQGNKVISTRCAQIRIKASAFYCDGLAHIDGISGASAQAAFTMAAAVPSLTNLLLRGLTVGISGTTTVGASTYEMRNVVSLNNTNDTIFWGGHTFNLINPVWSRLISATSSANATGTINEKYTYSLSATDSGGSAISGLRVYCKDQFDTQVFNATTDGSGDLAEQTLTYKGFVKSVALSTSYTTTTYSPHTIRFRKYGYNFLQESGDMGAAVDTSKSFITNSFVVASDATASAYTGISINGAAKTITVSGTRTIQELYDYTQAWADDSGNIQYDEPITTTDGITFTLTSGWSISVTGSLSGVTKTISGTVTVASSGFFEDATGAKWDVSGTTYYGKHIYRNVKAVTGGANIQSAVVACFDESGNDRTYNASRTLGGVLTDASGNVEGYYVWKIGSTTYTLTEYIGKYGYQWSTLPITANGTPAGSSSSYETNRLVTDSYVTLSEAAALALSGITATHSTAVIDGNAYTYSQIQDNLKARQATTSEIETGKKGYISYYQEGLLMSYDGTFYTLSSGWIIEDTTFGGTLKDSILRLSTAGTYNILLNSCQVNFEGAGTFDLRGSTITTDVTVDTIGNYTVLAKFTPGTTVTNNDPTNITVESSTAVTITLNNLIANSQVQIYDTDGSTEIDNDLETTTTYSFNYTYTTDVNIRVRIRKAGYEPIETTGTITSSGFSLNVSQEVDSVYSTNGIDGSTVTECAINGNNIDIQVDDPDNTTTAQRIYNWYQYYLATSSGIENTAVAITATDSTHYVFGSGVQIKNMDTVNPLNITGANIVPVSGPSTDVFDLSNGASIAINFNRVEGFAYSSGSGLSTEEHNWLSAVNDKAANIVSGKSVATKDDVIAFGS